MTPRLAGWILILIGITACEQANKTSDSKKYGNNPATGKYYDVRGFKMYAEVYGEGEPLLMIHGNGGSINQFVNQIPYFESKYQVIVADSRGQGKSIDKADSLSYEMMADDYAALLDAMNVDSAFVIGWSDGGINALLLSMRHPSKVRKLASTGANLWPDSTALISDFTTFLQHEYESLKRSALSSDSQKTSWKLTKLMAEQPQLAPAQLQSVKCPALIIGGDHDVIKEEHTMLIYKNIPKAYLWIVPNAGHATLFSHREEFNRTVDDFFVKPYREISGTARYN
jgi:pimeloyl-ACP methyl ester carboxylesterase